MLRVRRQFLAQIHGHKKDLSAQNADQFPLGVYSSLVMKPPEHMLSRIGFILLDELDA